MKTLLVAIMASVIAVGAVSASLTLGFDNDESMIYVNPLKSSAAMLGHLTLTVTDENGLVKAYLQTDNVVTNAGDECISRTMFAGSSGAACTSFGVGMFDTIVIGLGSSASATETTNELATPYKTTGFDSATVAEATAFDGADTVILTVFDDVDGTITEAGIQGGTTTTGNEAMLAIQSFTALPLGATDDLTIQWTVTIDGN